MIIKYQAGSKVTVEPKSNGTYRFDRMKLHRALLDGSNLKGASFLDADLRNAVFSAADASGADFDGSALMNAMFIGSKLSNARFVRARPIGADFEGADLTRADFTGADIGLASFRNSIVRGAVMLGLRLQEADFDGAVYDAATRWPRDFDPRAAGAIFSGSK